MQYIAGILAQGLPAGAKPTQVVYTSLFTLDDNDNPVPLPLPILSNQYIPVNGATGTTLEINKSYWLEGTGSVTLPAADKGESVVIFYGALTGSLIVDGNGVPVDGQANYNAFVADNRNQDRFLRTATGWIRYRAEGGISAESSNKFLLLGLGNTTLVKNGSYFLPEGSATYTLDATAAKGDSVKINYGEVNDAAPGIIAAPAGQQISSNEELFTSITLTSNRDNLIEVYTYDGNGIWYRELGLPVSSLIGLNGNANLKAGYAYMSEPVVTLPFNSLFADATSFTQGEIYGDPGTLQNQVIRYESLTGAFSYQFPENSDKWTFVRNVPNDNWFAAGVYTIGFEVVHNGSIWAKSGPGNTEPGVGADWTLVVALPLPFDENILYPVGAEALSGTQKGDPLNAIYEANAPQDRKQPYEDSTNFTPVVQQLYTYELPANVRDGNRILMSFHEAGEDRIVRINANGDFGGVTITIDGEAFIDCGAEKRGLSLILEFGDNGRWRQYWIGQLVDVTSEAALFGNLNYAGNFRSVTSVQLTTTKSNLTVNSFPQGYRPILNNASAGSVYFIALATEVAQAAQDTVTQDLDIDRVIGDGSVVAGLTELRRSFSRSGNPVFLPSLPQGWVSRNSDDLYYSIISLSGNRTETIDYGSKWELRNFSTGTMTIRLSITQDRAGVAIFRPDRANGNIVINANDGLLPDGSTTWTIPGTIGGFTNPHLGNTYRFKGESGGGDYQIEDYTQIALDQATYDALVAANEVKPWCVYLVEGTTAVATQQRYSEYVVTDEVKTVSVPSGQFVTLSDATLSPNGFDQREGLLVDLNALGVITAQYTDKVTFYATGRINSNQNTDVTFEIYNQTAGIVLHSWPVNRVSSSSESPITTQRVIPTVSGEELVLRISHDSPTTKTITFSLGTGVGFRRI